MNYINMLVKDQVVLYGDKRTACYISGALYYEYGSAELREDFK